MKTILLTTLFAFSSLAATQAADSLGDKIREAGHEAILGTWVDETSGGQAVKVVYSWTIKDHAISSTVTTGDRISTAIIGIDPESGDILHTGYDNNGGTISGRWDASDDSAILEATLIDGEQSERSFVVTHTFVDKDKIRIRMRAADSADSNEIILVRASN